MLSLLLVRLNNHQQNPRIVANETQQYSAIPNNAGTCFKHNRSADPSLSFLLPGRSAGGKELGWIRASHEQLQKAQLLDDYRLFIGVMLCQILCTTQCIGKYCNYWYCSDITLYIYVYITILSILQFFINQPQSLGLSERLTDTTRTLPFHIWP